MNLLGSKFLEFNFLLRNFVFKEMQSSDRLTNIILISSATASTAVLHEDDLAFMTSEPSQPMGKVLFRRKETPGGGKLSLLHWYAGCWAMASGLATVYDDYLERQEELGGFVLLLRNMRSETEGESLVRVKHKGQIPGRDGAPWT